MEKRHINRCECCLSMNNLSQTSDESINLIALCFSIQIANDLPVENLPMFICTECELNIKKCFDFRSQILNSQTKLKLIRNRSSKSTNNFNNKSGGQYFQSKDFMNVKEEFLSDIGDAEDTSDFITDDQSNRKKFIEINVTNETFECNLEQEFGSSIHNSLKQYNINSGSYDVQLVDNEIIKKKKTSAERTRKYRMRKRLASEAKLQTNSQTLPSVDTSISRFSEQNNLKCEYCATVKKNKTSAERTRRYRMRKKLANKLGHT